MALRALPLNASSAVCLELVEKRRREIMDRKKLEDCCKKLLASIATDSFLKDIPDQMFPTDKHTLFIEEPNDLVAKDVATNFVQQRR